MTTYNIITSHRVISNKEVFVAIKYLLTDGGKEQYSSYKRLLLISDLICHITDDGLLNNSVNLLKEGGFLKNYDVVNNILIENHLHNLSYSQQDCTRIRALVYAPMLEYEILMRTYIPFLRIDTPEFLFSIKGMEVSNNVDELVKLLKKKVTSKMVEEISRITDKTKQSNEINKLILNYSTIDYDNDTNSFKKEIKYLKSIKNHIPAKIEENPTYPFIKIGLKTCFNNYVKMYVIEEFIDFSYLYSRLRHENLIADMKHLTFIDWLKDVGYIKDLMHQKLMDQGQLRSLHKSKSTHRTNNFNNTFKAFL